MRLFQGGISVEPDVRRLLDLAPVDAGAVVPYEDVARVIGQDVHSSRFRTVSNAWRKRLMRERHLQSVCQDGAFRFLTANEAHDYGKRDLMRVGKAAGRLAVRVDLVDATKLTAERREAHALLRREAMALVDAARKSAKGIAAPTTVPANLRIAK